MKHVLVGGLIGFLLTQGVLYFFHQGHSQAMHDSFQDEQIGKIEMNSVTKSEFYVESETIRHNAEHNAMDLDRAIRRMSASIQRMSAQIKSLKAELKKFEAEAVIQ